MTELIPGKIYSMLSPLTKESYFDNHLKIYYRNMLYLKQDSLHNYHFMHPSRIPIIMADWYVADNIFIFKQIS